MLERGEGVRVMGGEKITGVIVWRKK